MKNKKAQTQPFTPPSSAQPITQPTLQPKKSKAWLWIIFFIFVLIVLSGTLGYIFVISKIPIFKYPGDISGYYRVSIYDDNAKEYKECLEFTDSINPCVEGVGGVSYGPSDENNERNKITFLKLTSGGDSFKSYLRSLCDDPLYSCEDTNGDIIVDGKSYDVQKMIYWFYEDDEYISLKQWGDIQILESPVVKYFLKKYPPIDI